MAANAELLKLTSRFEKNEKHSFDCNSDSDDEENVGHEDLLKKIKSLDKKESSKRYKGPLRSELYQHVSEYHLKSEGDDSHINLDDLVGSLQASNYNSKLKKSLESLQNMGRTVEVPLAKPAAERIQRVVAYEETSKDISKWDATVRKNRRADQLSFPLNAYKPSEMSTMTLTTTFKPSTPLEEEIAKLLQNSSQMLEREDKELSLEEEQALKKMSLEEALERRHELQKLRALQSYYEQKCRRMKKIKSKKYHRIKKRAEKRAMTKQTFEQLQKENPAAAQAELEKAEKLRIEERMSLKHRNTSKWAKNIIAKGINDVQARQALSEQLRVSRQLTETKLAESDSDEDEVNRTADKTESTENFRNFGLVGDSLENPWLLNDEKEKANMSEDNQEGKTSKERLRKLEPVHGKKMEEDGEEDSDDSEREEKFELVDDVKGGQKKHKNETKKKGKKLGGKKVEEVENNKDINVKKKVKTKLKEKQKKTRKNKKVENTGKTSTVETNIDTKEKVTKRKNADKDKVETEFKKKSKLMDSGVDEDIQEDIGVIGEYTMNDEDRTVSTEDHEQLLMNGENFESLLRTEDTEPVALKSGPVKNSLNPKNVFQIEDLGQENDLMNFSIGESDDETHAKRMTIQEAFANDDVIEEFVKEKEETAEASKAKDLDLSLPGWGGWGGPGIKESKSKKKFVVKAKPGPSRKDTTLAHVIINEGRDKKFAKNQISQLPFPYTSRDHWERSVRVPLGKDWNTTSVHQKLIKPRVVTLPGTIIEPIKAVQQSSGNVGSRKREKKVMGSGIEIHN